MGNWCSRPVLVDVERGRHVEDGPAVLDGHHPAGGEGPAVADPVDLVEDRDVGVARAQEVRVQRVDPAVLDGAARRHQGLGRHLAAEDALALLVGLTPRKMFTSMGSRSSRLTRNSRDALMAP
jgi:hypothetical protein